MLTYCLLSKNKLLKIILQKDLYKSIIATITILLLLQSCLLSSKITIFGKGDIKLQEVAFEDLKNWPETDFKKALQSFLHSCNKFAKMPQKRLVGGQIGNIIVSDFRDVCDIGEVVKTMSNDQAKNFFENWFKPFLVTNRYYESEGLFTGYYEAALKGSIKKTSRFKYPIYKLPSDINSEPYYSRSEIEDGALNNKNLEILYVDNFADLFFLHIQGSGRVELQDGSQIRVSYAGRNNQPYTAIGGYMVENGYISADNVNAQSIKDWLNDNPKEAEKVMNQNASYTFFTVSNNEYVIGAQNVPLTPNHSIAIDDDIIPYGMPIWLESYIKNEQNKKEPYHNLLISQDTGTAIVGTVRGDVFFGYGKDAERSASFMASRGKYYVLLPINVINKLQN